MHPTAAVAHFSACASLSIRQLVTLSCSPSVAPAHVVTSWRRRCRLEASSASRSSAPPRRTLLLAAALGGAPGRGELTAAQAAAAPVELSPVASLLAQQQQQHGAQQRKHLGPPAFVTATGKIVASAWPHLDCLHMQSCGTTRLIPQRRASRQLRGCSLRMRGGLPPLWRMPEPPTELLAELPQPSPACSR